ncbi:UNVERIFIED_CONTAM: hypothetical protein FKN15_033621 [Acipenser sinensis]
MMLNYDEVRAERRRELGVEETPQEVAADKNQDSGSDSQLNTVSLKEALERFDRTPSASSRSSRKSSFHTAVSDPTYNLELKRGGVERKPVLNDVEAAFGQMWVERAVDEQTLQALARRLLKMQLKRSKSGEDQSTI